MDNSQRFGRFLLTSLCHSLAKPLLIFYLDLGKKTGQMGKMLS